MRVPGPPFVQSLVQGSRFRSSRVLLHRIRAFAERHQLWPSAVHLAYRPGVPLVRRVVGGFAV